VVSGNGAPADQHAAPSRVPLAPPAAPAGGTYLINANLRGTISVDGTAIADSIRLLLTDSSSLAPYAGAGTLDAVRIQ
jgi:hypothetical protein